MLNVIELENRWVKYKIKSYIPYAVAGVSILGVSAIALYFFDADTSNKPKTHKEQLPKATKVITPKKTLPAKTKITKTILSTPVKTEKKAIEKKENIDSKKLILKPSFNFLSKLDNPPSEPKHYVQRTKQKKAKNKESSIDKTLKKAKNTISKEIPVKKIETKAVKTEIKNKKTEENTKIKIKRQNTQNDIYEVLKRFQKNNNPALSLFVARKYYELGEYRKSYNYALITNGINDKIEASWIIFAKSLVKLGKKKEAIDTLKKYLQHTDSNKANILLEDIISGKFR